VTVWDADKGSESFTLESVAEIVTVSPRSVEATGKLLSGTSCWSRHCPAGLGKLQGGGCRSEWYEMTVAVAIERYAEQSAPV
jgi:hypothetical protein